MIRRAIPIGQAPATAAPDAQGEPAAAATRDFGLRRFVPTALQERLQPLQRRSERALRRAAHLGQRQPVQALLAAGVDPTARSRNGEGDTALHRAARTSDAKGSPLQAMLQHREHALQEGLPTFDVNARTVFNPLGTLDPVNRRGQTDGDTALITAARQGNLGSVEALLNATGIDPRIQNGAGFTALDVVDPAHVEVRLALRSWRAPVAEQADEEPPPAYQKDVPVHLGHSKVPQPSADDPKPRYTLQPDAPPLRNPFDAGKFKIARKPVPGSR